VSCVLLVVLALVVAEWGGFRIQVAGVRFAATSVARALLGAGLLGLVRHFFVPRPPIYRDLPIRLATSWRKRSSASRAAWAALLGTRPAVLFVGYLAVVMFGYSHNGPPLRISPNEVANLQVRWDSAWYFGIANEGYRYWSTRTTDQQNIVFFPALPTLMRVGGRLLGRTATSLFLAGTLITLGAFFWALTFLYRLVSEMIGNEDAARSTVWLLATYPFALFYGAVYTESLFLLGAVAAFYRLNRGEYVRAGLWGLLVGLTRPNGCFLSIPLAMVAAGPWLPRWLAEPLNTRTPGQHAAPQPSSIGPAIVAAAMPGVGVLLYSGYIWYLTGYPFTWATGHAAWGREYQGLATLVTDRWMWLTSAGVYKYTSELPNDLLNALGALFVVVAAWPVWFRLGPPYAVFILINILPPLAAGGMLSAGRFSSVLFPAFIWLATAIPARQRPGWNATFMAIQALNASLFYTWRDLY
jgi:hypothetical protein